MADDDGEDGGATGNAAAFATFRSLVDAADRKFALVRDLPPYSRGQHHLLYYRKVFKAYTRLWRFQQEHRRELLDAGLRRCEIGEIASRIGQLYYGQYLRTSEARFLVEAYVFYEAILNRGYFEATRGTGKPDLMLRYKELRFYARFFVVAMLLHRIDMARQLAERFRALVDESAGTFPKTSFREWKQALQQITRFLKTETAFASSRPLRYNAMLDAHPSSVQYIAKFHPNRVLKLHDAILTSYRRNEVKFAELTLDTFRMSQCLEWELNGSLYQLSSKEPSENGALSDQSGVSGVIDINLSGDMTDSLLSANPRKAVIYHPSVSHFIAVTATICEELPSDSILLIYLSASGKTENSVSSLKDVPGSLNSSNQSHAPLTSRIKGISLSQPYLPDKQDSNAKFGSYICLGSQGSVGLNYLYPEDLIPFTRRPLFIVIDSDNSHAFKVIHGSERGESSILLLSHEGTAIGADTGHTFCGGQFTYFLTSPLQAFCQLVGLSSDLDDEACSISETLFSSALAEWEVLLFTSKFLGQVWAQVLCDPFLRRLILRFIFCRAVLYHLRTSASSIQRLPECVPSLPEVVSPSSSAVQGFILRVAKNFGVLNYFHFQDSIVDDQNR